MAKKGRSLAEYQSYHWASLLGVVCTVAGFPLWWDTRNRWWIVALACSLVGFGLWVEAVRYRITALFSGLREYIPKFSGGKNAEVFREIERSYSYLGLTFSLAVGEFCTWYENDRRGDTRIRILLLDPSAKETLTAQVAYEEPSWPHNSPPQDWEKLIETGMRTKEDAIKFTLDALARLKGANQNIEVRFHRQRLHEWIHLVDGELLYVGLLQKGDSGRACPVAVLEKRGKASLFDHYNGWFESLWEENRGNAIDLKQVRDLRLPGQISK